MDNVQFDEEDVNKQLFKRNQASRGLIGLTMKTGLAKNEAQANIVLVVVSVLCLIGIVFVIMMNRSSISKEAAKALKTPEQIKVMMNLK
ncbi:MAG: hypothetical protein WAV25_02860 [Minisyncoccia bacterium]